MQISNQNNSVNFTSTPIHSVNLKKITNETQDGFVKAVFSKLDPSDLKDIETVKDITQKWDGDTTLASAFKRSFIFTRPEGINYNAIELFDAKNPAGKIVGLVKSFSKNKIITKNLFLQQIIVEPNLAFKNTGRSIKGVGEVMLAECFAWAKKMNLDSVDIPSSNNSFYFNTFKKAGIDIVEGCSFDKRSNEFSIAQRDFDKYINYCKEKYKLTF